MSPPDRETPNDTKKGQHLLSWFWNLWRGQDREPVIRHQQPLAQSTTGFEELPPEALTQIVSNLDLRDRVSARAATRRLCAAVAHSPLTLGPAALLISQGTAETGESDSIFVDGLLSTCHEKARVCLTSSEEAEECMQLLELLFSLAHVPALVLVVNFAPPLSPSLERVLRLMEEDRVRCRKLSFDLERATYDERLFDFLDSCPFPPDKLELRLSLDTPLHVGRLIALRPLRQLSIEEIRNPQTSDSGLSILEEDLIRLVKRHADVRVECGVEQFSDESVERVAEVVFLWGHRLRVRVPFAAFDFFLARRGLERRERQIIRRATGERIEFHAEPDALYWDGVHRMRVGERAIVELRLLYSYEPDYQRTGEILVDIHDDESVP